MTRRELQLVGLALWCCAAAAVAESPETLGARLYYACATCHGAEGKASEARQTPALAALPAWYAAAQLRAYRAGWRGARSDDFTARKMTLFAEALASEDALEAVAEHAASLGEGLARARQQESAVSVSPDAVTARRFAGCASCHGPAGEGIESLGAPPIAGQPAWYLKRQMEAFANGNRGAHPDDALGQKMRAAPAPSAPAERAALIRYIASLAGP